MEIADEFQGPVQGNASDSIRSLYFQKLQSPGRDADLDRKLVAMVLDHAKQIVAHPTRPTIAFAEAFSRHPFGEILIEETLEEFPVLSEAEDYFVEAHREKRFSCVTMLDCSASMSGEKHLLASVAVAVLLLQVPTKDTSVIVFSSDARSIKNLSVEEPVSNTVLRFLKSQPKGFTNIGRGLEEGLSQLKRLGGRKRRVGLIATDGRTTEGRDPVDIAKEFDFLVVLHTHGPGSHLEASQAMAQKGHGVCLEVERFEELPRRLYDALRMLARL